MTKSLFVLSCYKPFPLCLNREGLGPPHHLPLWRVSGGPTIYYLFWAKCHPSKAFSQKKLWLETQNILFSPTTKPHPLNPLTMSLPPLYWLGTSRWCSDPCVLAPLSFVFVFFYCHVVFVAGLVLFLHVFPAMFVISFGLAFLSFMQFLLLTLYIVPCFFLSRFFISIFIPILLYKRIWAFVGQIVFDGSKGY